MFIFERKTGQSYSIELIFHDFDGEFYHTSNEYYSDFVFRAVRIV